MTAEALSLKEEIETGSMILSSYKKDGDNTQRLVAFVVENYGISGLSEACGLSLEATRKRFLDDRSFDKYNALIHDYAVKLFKWMKYVKETYGDEE